MPTRTSIPKLQPPRGNIESLAPEVFLLILSQFHGLATLDNLLRASPATFRVFNTYGVEIIEAILDSSPICEHISVLMRVTALIRRGALPHDSLAQFESRTTKPMMLRSEPSEEILSPLRFSPETPAAILRGIIASFRQIETLSWEFLNVHLKRYRELNQRRMTEELMKPNSLRQTQELARNAAPPHWDEEQRVMRAFWRFSLLYDLRRAADSGLLNWSREDVETLYEKPLLDLYLAHEVCTIIRVSGEWVNIPHPEHFELSSVDEYISVKQGIASLSQDTGSWLVPDRSKMTQREHTSTLPGEKGHPQNAATHAQYLKYASRGCSTYVGGFQKHLETYFKKICDEHQKPETLFIWYGFAFWNSWRLEQWNTECLRGPPGTPRYGRKPRKPWMIYVQAPFDERRGEWEFQEGELDCILGLSQDMV